ncbi:HAD family hydrolase [Nocardioides sp.]|uniref:HAD family hydrolase n=1 Tax=Nocardioides sp. TaxID=35761 RepID=UPI00271E6E1D|nr:HAD-IA family hydrolase [Nocardioides sp.]MDO9457554.1 HAD-IA family hydrolase [Nocardioides sp.]
MSDGVTIRHVLLDADGVLQDLPGGWFDRLRPWLGDRSEEFIKQSWVDEVPTLRGEGDFFDHLGNHLAAYGVDVGVEELFAAVWTSIELVPSSIELVHRLRAAGYGVHLGTNQERHRAAYMRTELGFDELFDVSCYSWELGAIKTEPAYFEQAAALIGADPAEILFVDDRLDNVETARSVGLAGVHWTFTDGLDAIESRLGEHGVRVAG